LQESLFKFEIDQVFLISISGIIDTIISRIVDGMGGCHQQDQALVDYNMVAALFDKLLDKLLQSHVLLEFAPFHLVGAPNFLFAPLFPSSYRGQDIQISAPGFLDLVDWPSPHFLIRTLYQSLSASNLGLADQSPVLCLFYPAVRQNCSQLCSETTSQ